MTYKTILVPLGLEGEASWRTALPVAVEHGRAFGATLHLATVILDLKIQRMA